MYMGYVSDVYLMCMCLVDMHSGFRDKSVTYGYSEKVMFLYP